VTVTPSQLKILVITTFREERHRRALQGVGDHSSRSVSHPDSPCRSI